MLEILSAAFTGTVDFSTTIFLPWLNIVPQYVGDTLCSLHRHRGLLHHDLPALALLHRVGNHPRRQLHILQVSRLALSQAESLGGSVHADEDQVGLPDGGLDVR